MGEGEELLWEELVLFGEGDEVVAEDEEGGEELGFPLGEFRERCRRRDHEQTVQRGLGKARGWFADLRGWMT